MRTYQIRNEVTGEIVETYGGRRHQVRHITAEFMKDNKAHGKPCRTYFRSVPTEGLKIICVQPLDPKHEYYSQCFAMLDEEDI